MIKTNELKHLRIDLKMSIIELSKRSGVNRDTITRIENGAPGVSIKFVERIADCLGMDIVFTPKKQL